MPRRVVLRLLTGIALVLAVVTATFLLINLAPGDPARLWVGPGATAADLARARHALGLDRPLLVRYVTWLGGFVTGHWGTSIALGRPVSQVLLAALPYTLVLSAASLAVTYVGGIIVGLAQAVKRRSVVDTVVTVATLTIYGMPSYWLALVLVLVFSYLAARHGWPGWLRFPALGASGIDAEFLSPWGQFVDHVRHLALPLVTLGAIGIAGTARFVRGAAVDVYRHAYVRTAQAKGLPTRVVELRHVLRNALLPVVTLLGLSLPALFSGTVFVETIFAWPGMGRMLVSAVTARDYPIVLAATAVYAILVVLGNLLADVLYAVADPRLRRGSA